MNLKLAKRIYKLLGDGDGGGDMYAPPGSDQRLELFYESGESMFIAATYPNDGHEFWMGTRNKWWGFLRRSEALKLAWFIIWNWWIVGTWCGVKRWIWYKALSAIVKSYKSIGPIEPPTDYGPEAGSVTRQGRGER